MCERMCVSREKLWFRILIKSPSFSFCSFSFLLFDLFSSFYLVDQSNCLPSYLLCFSGRYVGTYQSVRMAQLGGKKTGYYKSGLGRVQVVVMVDHIKPHCFHSKTSGIDVNVHLKRYISPL